MSGNLSIPDHLIGKAVALPESSFGAARVTLLLADGRRINDVYLAWGSDIIKVGQQIIKSPGELDFRVCDVENIQ